LLIRFTERFRCPDHPEVEFLSPTPQLFSFNNPYGSCPECTGFGAVLRFDESLIVCNPNRSLAEGAVDPWRMPRYEGRRKKLYDFARRHPGFYGQRLAAVEIEVIGLLPPEGVRGTLRGGVVSHYAQADGSEKSRVHSLDTLALSEYTLRGDAYVFRADARELGLFEGHGVATTWEIDLPRGSNNLDYRLISDVQLVLYYTARHSDTLRDATFDRVKVSGAEHAIVATKDAVGSATMTNVSAEQIKLTIVKIDSPKFELIRGNGNGGLDEDRESSAGR